MGDFIFARVSKTGRGGESDYVQVRRNTVRTDGCGCVFAQWETMQDNHAQPTNTLFVEMVIKLARGVSFKDIRKKIDSTGMHEFRAAA